MTVDQPARFLRSHRRELEHNRQTLDTLRERFDVRLGPLTLDAGVRAEPVKK